MKLRVAKGCLGSMEITESPECELFKEACEVNAFDVPDSPLARSEALATLSKTLDSGK